MTTIVTRAGKGSPLTWNEGDANFNNLNSAVIAAQATADTALAAATTTFTSVAVGVVPASGGGTTNFLRADGTWAAAGGGGGTPAGATTEIQINSAGSFGADGDFTYDPATKRLRVNAVTGTCTTPGNIQIYGASATDSNNGARVQIHAGMGGVTTGNGGRVELYAGDAQNTTLGEFGGSLLLKSGYGATGGDVSITVSDSADAAGSNMVLYSGNSQKAASNGGDIWLGVGAGGVGGLQGNVYITDVGNALPVASFWGASKNTRFGTTKTDPGYKVQIDGDASNVALRIVQGATAGTALSMYDDTATGYINVQPGASTGTIVSNKQVNFYVNTKYPLVLDTNANIGAGGVTTTSAWGSTYNALELGRAGNALMFGNAGGNAFFTTNAYYNGTNWKYANGTSATNYLWLKDGGGLDYAYAAAGVAGNNITFNTLFSIDTAGSVTIAGASIPQNSQSAAYTLVASDANKHILHPSADTTARVFTIPANSSVPFAIGTAITFVNQNAAGTITISITTDTMRLAGPGTTGSRTLAANGIATALKITSTEWIISGTGLT